MKMPNVPYTGRYLKGTFQGSSGNVNVSNPSSKKYYGSMIDAPGFKDGGRTEKPIRKTTKGSGANYRPTKSGAGMTSKGVKAYRAANPGSKLKTAVTGDVKKGSKAAKRRKSYCARSAGQLKNSSAKTRNDPNSRIRQARRRWKC